MTTSPRRIVWGIGASVALASITFTGAASAASLTPAMRAGVFAAGASPSNIDPSQTGTLEIHKFAEPATPTGLPNNGTALTPAQLAGLNPLQGVQFSVQQVTNVDLTTQAGWASIQGLTAATVQGDSTTYPLGSAQTLTTDASGNASATGLPLGLYLVTETSAGSNSVASTVAPFLVTLPMPQGSGTWLYDVNAYPKNSVVNVGKTVDDSGAMGIGDEVDWTITSTVPTEGGTNTITQAEVTDPIDARLDLKSVTISLAAANGNSVTLAPTDYTITPTGGAAASPAGTVDVKFTAAGLAVLQANQGGKLSVKIGTIVKSLGADGVITDKGDVTWNGIDTPTNQTVTNWGSVLITKNAAGDATKLLAGASFQVFASLADATAGTNPITSGTSNTFTTDSTGTVKIPGLKADGTDGPGGSAGTNYWIVETQAPAGYNNNKTPIQVLVTPNGTTAGPDSVTVSDTQVSGFLLPLTGSTGTLIYTAGGLTLAAGAGAVIVLTTRRRTKAQTA